MLDRLVNGSIGQSGSIESPFSKIGEKLTNAKTATVDKAINFLTKNIFSKISDVFSAFKAPSIETIKVTASWQGNQRAELTLKKVSNSTPFQSAQQANNQRETIVVQREGKSYKLHLKNIADAFNVSMTELRGMSHEEILGNLQFHATPIGQEAQQASSTQAQAQKIQNLPPVQVPQQTALQQQLALTSICMNYIKEDKGKLDANQMGKIITLSNTMGPQNMMNALSRCRGDEQLKMLKTFVNIQTAFDNKEKDGYHPSVKDISNSFTIKNGNVIITQDELGLGGFKRVFNTFCLNNSMDTDVKARIRGEQNVTETLEESALLRKIPPHPNIIKPYTIELVTQTKEKIDPDTGEIKKSEPKLILYQPKARGGDGRTLITPFDRPPLKPPRNIAYTLAGACGGLAHMHANGWVHKDMKPANFLLDGDKAMVADMGAAEKNGEAGKTISTPHFESPEYAKAMKAGRRAATDSEYAKSPEYAKHYPNMKATPEYDSWSMGVTAFYILTGKAEINYKQPLCEMKQDDINKFIENEIKETNKRNLSPLDKQLHIDQLRICNQLLTVDDPSKRMKCAEASRLFYQISQGHPVYAHA